MGDDDACPNDPDNDADGDGVCGDVDNCPNGYNTDQADSDNDNIGDICDVCSDTNDDGDCEYSFSPTAYWGFDEDSGSIAQDSTGYGNNGTITNSQRINGILDNALELQGTIDSMVTVHNPVLNGLEDFTVEFWIQTTDDNVAIISAANSSEDNEYLMFINDNKLNVYIKGPIWITNVNFNDGEWHHIVVTRTVSEVNVYQDGNWNDSTTSLSTDALVVDPGGIVIGQDQDCLGGCFQTSQSLAGNLDEIAVYDYAMTEEEVAQRYELFDEDGDGILDDHDDCPGYDDNVDVDNDGIADGCDCDDNNPDKYPGNLEVCDGIDNDCDDQTDEDYTATPTACGIGACASTGELTCQNGSEVDTCQEETAAPDDSACDGIDNNCDGQIDEDYTTTPTTCGIGACTSTGELTCQNGSEVDTCQEETAAPDDSACDDIDNDCDGHTDEDCVCLPSEEVCDGIDNDCDDKIDENLPIDIHNGDLNGDGNVTPQDALQSFQDYLGIIQLSECQQAQSNVNGDDSITPADALCIFQKYLGLPSCLDE